MIIVRAVLLLLVFTQSGCSLAYRSPSAPFSFPGLPYLGVEVEELVNMVGFRTLVIKKVEPGSPAFYAGLRPGEAIHAIDGIGLRFTNDLAALLTRYPPGAVVDVTLQCCGTQGGWFRHQRVQLGSLTSRGSFPRSIQIVGPLPFQEAIQQALSFLEQSPMDFLIVARATQKILYDPGACPFTDAFACAAPFSGQIFFAQQPARGDFIHVASVLAHEATHLMGFDEQGAYDLQVGFLQRVRAPWVLIDRVVQAAQAEGVRPLQVQGR